MDPSDYSTDTPSGRPASIRSLPNPASNGSWADLALTNHLSRRNNPRYATFLRSITSESPLLPGNRQATDGAGVSLPTTDTIPLATALPFISPIPSSLPGIVSPVHYCYRHNCCYRFDHERKRLKAKDFGHLPVCHEECWKRERNRLRRKATAEEWTNCEFPICHRECYAKILRMLPYPESSGSEMVLQHRGKRERLGIYKLEHWVMRDI